MSLTPSLCLSRLILFWLLCFAFFFFFLKFPRETVLFFSLKSCLLIRIYFASYLCPIRSSADHITDEHFCLLYLKFYTQEKTLTGLNDNESSEEERFSWQLKQMAVFHWFSYMRLFPRVFLGTEGIHRTRGLLW